MKKHLFLIAFLISYTGVNAQDSQGGTPYSFDNPEINSLIDIVEVTPPDIEKLKAEDADHAEKSAPYRIGVSIPINFSISNAGTWTDLPYQNATLWQLTIRSEGAQSIGFGYDKFFLPEGSKLYLYNKSKSMIIGAYTSINNSEDLSFSNQKVTGDEITLELFIPNDKRGLLQLSINELDYFYRGGESEILQSGFCEVNVNCSPEGTNWQSQKKGVCLLDIRIGGTNGYWYNCTGSLVNNTKQDCAPLVLLADHCHYDAGYATTADYNVWKFKFHYESFTCAGTTGPSNYVKTGCTLKAHDTYGSNYNGSDFCLVQINTPIALTYNVYYNGWDRTNTGSISGVSIHHPDGDIKKISTYTTSLTSLNTGGNGTHWRVYWAATTNGQGVTEGGSSGSPIFNSAGRIIGTLTGGTSYCTAPNDPDQYGKFYYHWDKNGSTANKRLKEWLDPTNSNVTQLDGRTSCTIGIEKFTMDEEKVIIYPSPATIEIYFEINQHNNMIENVCVYNLLGVLVKQIESISVLAGKATLKISELPDGLYFITAKKDQTILKGQFVKVK